MNLIELVKHIPNGISNLYDWVGSDGRVVEQKVAQHRANTCRTCSKNQHVSVVTEAVALAIRAQLGLKNRLKLRVEGEKELKSCEACSCPLRLLVWCPQERVESSIDAAEMAKLPSFCWKVSKQ